MRKHIILFFSLLVILVACNTPITPSLDLEWSQVWPDGLRAEQALIVQDVVYFSNFGLTMGGSPESTPIIAAFDLNTREMLWSVEEKPLVPMVNDGKRIFVFTQEGIVAISTMDGSTLWQTAIADNDYHNGELLVGDGQVFCLDHRGRSSNLYALDSRTGVIEWTVSLTEPTDWFIPVGGPIYWQTYHTMSYDRETLYLRILNPLAGVEFQCALLALDTTDGHRLWEFPFDVTGIRGEGLPGGAASLPVFSEQAVYFGAFGKTSYALDRATGQMLWERESSIEANPIYVDGHIITVSGYQTIAALDVQTGSVDWMVPFMENSIGGVLSPFVFSDEHLIFYTSDNDRGQLSVVDVDSGEIILSLSPDFPDECRLLSPVTFAAYGEHLYLVTLDCVHSFRASWGR
jgi:outer membrane protein assembly factor BamB